MATKETQFIDVYVQHIRPQVGRSGSNLRLVMNISYHNAGHYIKVKYSCVRKTSVELIKWIGLQHNNGFVQRTVIKSLFLHSSW